MREFAFKKLLLSIPFIVGNGDSCRGRASMINAYSTFRSFGQKLKIASPKNKDFDGRVQDEVATGMWASLQISQLADHYRKRPEFRCSFVWGRSRAGIKRGAERFVFKIGSMGAKRQTMPCHLQKNRTWVGNRGRETSCRCN